MMRPTLFLLICCPLIPSLRAAERVALVIGNDAYQHARKLNAAVSDATAIGSTLSQLGFEVITVKDANLEAMFKALEAFRQKASGSSATLIYYAGHGIEAHDTNYLLPIDAKLDTELQLKYQAMSMDAMLGELRGLNVPARMVILDCCRNNPLEGRSWLNGRTYEGGLRGIDEQSLEEATLVVYAASPGKPAMDRLTEKDPHSPFTTALLAELPQPGVHSFEVFGRVEERVLNSTGNRQKPRLFYNGSTLPFRSFTFAAAATAANTTPTPDTPPAPPVPVPNSTPSIPDTPPAPSLVLPARGYFSIEELFSPSPYAAYNAYSPKEILKRAQSALKTAGYYSGSPDGITGPGTQSALNAWQQNSGLTLTGRLDPATLQKLNLTGIQPLTAPASTPSKPKPTPAPRTSPTPKPASSSGGFFVPR